MTDNRRQSQPAPPPPPPERRARCFACGCPLGLPLGYGGTGLCGPCATGGADTLDEVGETW